MSRCPRLRRFRLATLLLSSLPLSLGAQDTLVVRADNPPVWGASPRLVEELRIGVLEGDPRYTFGFVPNLIEAPDGVIWVIDRGLHSVRRYSSSTGEHLGDVGRQGKGPNEFAYVSDIALLPNDRVVVLDPFNGRAAVFELDATRIGQYRSPVRRVGGPQPLQVDTAGRLFFYDREQLGPAYDGPPLPTGTFFVPPPSRAIWIRMSERGQIEDTLRVPEGMRAWVSPHGYLVQGRNSEYALHRPLRDGRVVRIERSWSPVPYEDAEREEAQAVADAGARRVARLTGAPRTPERVPATKPAWFSFTVDHDARIWVGRHVAGTRVGETDAQRARREQPGGTVPRTWGQPSVWDVIEPSGRYLGTVTFPNSASSDFASRLVGPVFARGTTVWTIERGELDEQYLVRYRITPGN